MEPNSVSTPSPDPPVQSSVEGSPAEGTLLDRVRGLVPIVRGLIGKVQTVGVASAGAAVVLWVILFGDAAWPLSAQTLVALLVLAVLLVPAAGTFLAVLTLREVLDLPGRIRALPGAVRESASEASGHVTGSAVSEGRGRTGRLLGFFGVLWKLRGIVEETRGSWLKTLALARFARLASLPFALALVGAFALNFLVIAAACVAVLAVLLF
jgi:hypothetical protein